MAELEDTETKRQRSDTTAAETPAESEESEVKFSTKTSGPIPAVTGGFGSVGGTSIFGVKKTATSFNGKPALYAVTLPRLVVPP